MDTNRREWEIHHEGAKGTMADPLSHVVLWRTRWGKRDATALLCYIEGESYPRNLQNLDRVFRKEFKEVTGRDLPRRGRSG
jgi:hypothetical protein